MSQREAEVTKFDRLESERENREVACTVYGDVNLTSEMGITMDSSTEAGGAVLSVERRYLYGDDCMADSLGMGEGKVSGPLVAPECPECESRGTKLQFDTDEHGGVIRCANYDEDLLMVAVFANKQLTTVRDPTTGGLKEASTMNLISEDASHRRKRVVPSEQRCAPAVR